MQFFIYETDLRQKSISRNLEKNGLNKVSKENLKDADLIVLPFTSVENHINFDDEFFSLLKKGVIVFTGANNITLKKIFESKKITLITIMDNMEISILNATPTAEGTIYHAIENMKTCIACSKILVLGYGICGSVIANKFNLLGGNVTIIENSKEKIALAKNSGLNIIESTKVNNNYDLIVNTIPSKILSSKVIDSINKNCIILDIASKPYGFSSKELEDKNIFYKRLNSLPSNFGVDYSGENIGKFIYNKIRSVN